MGRIRTVKPEFFTHEQLFDAEVESGLPLRLIYAGLWTVCDREGRFVWRPRTLKASVAPYDNLDFSEALNGLASIGLVVQYEVDGIKYGFVPSWKKHQVINQREAASKIPPPPDDVTLKCTHVQAHAESGDAYEYNGIGIAPALRETIYERHGRKCCRCGTAEDMTIDHIFPRSIGGTHAIANLRPMCRKCNSARPVQGKALIDDLAKDGFSLEDMDSICTHVTKHVQARGEGKGKEMEGKEFIGDPPKEKRKRFVPPTLEEVRAFCQSNGLTWSPQRFIDHYAAGGWKLSGGRPMADWQAAARNWKDYGATPYQPPPKPEPPRKMITPIPRNV